MLTWNIYYENFNAKRIETFNIFSHYRFWEDCIENKKKNKKDKDNFVKQLRQDLMYYFWSKCEWEIVLTSWPERKDFKDKKIDVFEQIELNWDRFVDYVWNNIKDIKKEIK